MAQSDVIKCLKEDEWISLSEIAEMCKHQCGRARVGEALKVMYNNGEVERRRCKDRPQSYDFKLNKTDGNIIALKPLKLGSAWR